MYRFIPLLDATGAAVHVSPMPTYVYETIPEDPSEEAMRFEIKQSIKDDALSTHPETGVPVKRVISGGISITPGKGGASDGGSCCSGGSCCN